MIIIKCAGGYTPFPVVVRCQRKKQFDGSEVYPHILLANHKVPEYILVLNLLITKLAMVGAGMERPASVRPFFFGDRQALEEHRPCKVTLLTLNAVIMLMIQDARS